MTTINEKTVLKQIMLSLMIGLAIPGVGSASTPAQQTIIAGYAAGTKKGNTEFVAFSAERGRQLFSRQSTSGKPDTPSCTTCHSSNPHQQGETRAGKAIEPMALSVSPDRYSDIDKVEKWFGRNCNSVLGRDCTSMEKGDFLTFMINQ